MQVLGSKPALPNKPKVVCVLKCPSAGCMAQFKKEWRLRDHVSRHAGQKTWKCDKAGCDKAFFRRTSLLRHQQQHSSLKKHICPSAGCRAAFGTKRSLKRHVLYKHGQGGPLKCSEPGCLKTFRKKPDLRVHLAQHTGDLLFPCDLPGCEKKLASSAALSAHRRQHRGYTCPLQGCGVVSPTWSGLQEHRKKHPLELQCAMCKKSFKKRNALRRHKAKHMKVRLRLPCPREDCKETFETVFNLTHHVRKTHLCLQTYRCYHAGCDRAFAMRESLLRHLATHDPDKKKLKMPAKARLQGAPRRSPLVEEDLSRLFNQKLLFRFKTLMESNLSRLFNERQLRDPAEPEVNLSGLFQLPPNRARTEKAA
ncbi:P43 5S RNA-binding protein-like [Spea bombifrons]|uniref:P43 5S RNA-binding protein-like n=1 Tax=Spea bombifrons TaxID=233779 RepID=UPI00234A24D8|nr:P43 5S RNA-binding protein-like [Spea bombifrons]